MSTTHQRLPEPSYAEHMRALPAPPLAQQHLRVAPSHPYQHLGAAAPYHGLHPSAEHRLGSASVVSPFTPFQNPLGG